MGIAAPPHSWGMHSLRRGNRVRGRAAAVCLTLVARRYIRAADHVSFSRADAGRQRCWSRGRKTSMEDAGVAPMAASDGARAGRDQFRDATAGVVRLRADMLRACNRAAPLISQRSLQAMFEAVPARPPLPTRGLARARERDIEREIETERDR